MKIDFADLKARILSMFGSYRAFAAALGVSVGTLNRWLNNKTSMPMDALYRMVDLLLIPDAEVNYFFFRRLEA